MRVIVVYPLCPAKGQDLEEIAFASVCGGFTEELRPWPDEPDVVLVRKRDDSVKIRQNRIPNRYIRDAKGKCIDIVYDPFIIAGKDENGYRSLNEFQRVKFGTMFKTPDDFGNKKYRV